MQEQWSIQQHTLHTKQPDTQRSCECPEKNQTTFSHRAKSTFAAVLLFLSVAVTSCESRSSIWNQPVTIEPNLQIIALHESDFYTCIRDLRHGGKACLIHACSQDTPLIIWNQRKQSLIIEITAGQSQDERYEYVVLPGESAAINTHSIVDVFWQSE